MRDYQVREGKCMEHEGKVYEGGAVVELTTELAVFHEPNIQPFKPPEPEPKPPDLDPEIVPEPPKKNLELEESRESHYLDNLSNDLWYDRES